jgi:hypothetical protein
VTVRACLAQDAALIVTPQGGQSFNAVFARRGAVLIELAPAMPMLSGTPQGNKLTFDVVSHYFTFAAMGLRAWVLPSVGVSEPQALARVYILALSLFLRPPVSEVEGRSSAHEPTRFTPPGSSPELLASRVLAGATHALALAHPLARSAPHVLPIASTFYLLTSPASPSTGGPHCSHKPCGIRGTASQGVARRHVGVQRGRRRPGIARHSRHPPPRPLFPVRAS